MNLFDAGTNQLLGMLYSGAERETLDYVVNGTRGILGDNAPDRKAVKELGNLTLSCRAMFPCQLSPFSHAGCLPRYLTE